MGQFNDFKNLVCQDYIKEKLTLEERAMLLCDILDELGYDRYANEDGSFDIEQASFDLEVHEGNS